MTARDTRMSAPAFMRKSSMIDTTCEALIERLQLAAIRAKNDLGLACLCLEAADGVNDLVEAVERLLCVLADNDDDWDAAEDLARSALAKARGESPSTHQDRT